MQDQEDRHQAKASCPQTLPRDSRPRAGSEVGSRTPEIPFSGVNLSTVEPTSPLSFLLGICREANQLHPDQLYNFNTAPSFGMKSLGLSLPAPGGCLGSN